MPIGTALWTRMWGQLFFSVPSIGSRLISSLTRTSNYFYPVGGLPTYPFTILHTHSLVLLSSMHHLPTFFIIAYIVPPSSEDFFFAAIVHFSTLSFILSPTLLWVLVSSSWSRSEYNHRHSFPSCIITPYLSCCHTPRRYLQPLCTQIQQFCDALGPRVSCSCGRCN